MQEDHVKSLTEETAGELWLELVKESKKRKNKNSKNVQNLEKKLTNSNERDSTNEDVNESENELNNENETSLNVTPNPAEKDGSKEKPPPEANDYKRKFDLGGVVLPYDVQVGTGPNSKTLFMAKLLEVDEANWKGKIKWDSTKEIEIVDLDRIDPPAGIGLAWKTDAERRQSIREPKPVIPIQTAPPAVTTRKRINKASTNKSNKKSRITSPTNDSTSFYAYELKEKETMFRELFCLPEDGEFTQDELNIGYVNANIRHVKTHKDANLAQRLVINLFKILSKNSQKFY